MATLHFLGSSSKGNCAILVANGKFLILDAGIKKEKVLQATNWDITNISACVLTHSHADHVNCLPQVFFNTNCSCYSCQDVANKYPFVNVLKPKQRYQIGEFVVMPLVVPHNVENYAYVIQHTDFGKLLFATDLCSFPYKIKGLNWMVIECNNDSETMAENAFSGVMSYSSSEYHLSLDNCIEAVRRNMSEDLLGIILIHLSDTNSNVSHIKQRFSEELNLQVEIADNSTKFNISKYDF